MDKDTIRLEKINEVYSKLHVSNEGILYEIDSQFTFRVPNYQFMPQYRLGVWDGNIHLFQRKTLQFPNGLISYLESFCQENGYSLDIENTLKPNKITLQEIETYCNSLNVHSKKKAITPRDYQISSTHYIVENKRGVIVSSTSSGKSLVLYMITRRLLEKENANILLIVPTISLVGQMYTDFQDYSSHNGFKVEKYCHQIYSGKEKNTNKKVVISTWQSLYNLKPIWFKNFDCLIIDEVQTAAAKSLQGIANKCVNARYRIGTTGSLQEAKAHSLAIEAVLGKAKVFSTTKELMDRGEVADTTIKTLELQYPEETCKKLQGIKYADEINWLIAHKSRNQFIRNLTLKVCKESGNTLILFGRLSHGKYLHDEIVKKSGKQNVFLVNGKTKADIRNQIREIVETEKDAIILAIFQVFQAGVSIRNLHNLILVHPVKSLIRLKQSLGRTGRISETKTTATIYHIGDNLVYKKKSNTTYKHFLYCVKIYFQEKYKITFHKVKIDNKVPK